MKTKIQFEFEHDEHWELKAIKNALVNQMFIESWYEEVLRPKIKYQDLSTEQYEMCEKITEELDELYQSLKDD